MTERAREDEMPISPKPDSPVPEIFSSKKIFFLNSSRSGSRRSEIPHIEADYCPRDEVSRRLFHHNNESCDCDCASDGCGGCLRRNKQCFFKFFVLALSIVLVLLLFGSLSYNLTRSKTAEESFEFERTEWVSHYHKYPAKEEKYPTQENATALVEAEPQSDLPVPVYEHPEDYDSSEDSQKLFYHLKENIERHDQIEPIPFVPLSAQKTDAQSGILIIYDGREPSRVKRSISFKSEENDLSKEKGKNNEFLFEELNEVEEGMNKFWESYFKRGRTVFEPFSLATPSLSTPLGTDEYSIEEEIEDELRNRFLSQPVPENFELVPQAKETAPDALITSSGGLISEPTAEKNYEEVTPSAYAESSVVATESVQPSIETESLRYTFQSHFMNDKAIVITESQTAATESETTTESEIATESETTTESEIATESETTTESEIATESETTTESEIATESETTTESVTAIKSDTATKSETATEIISEDSITIASLKENSRNNVEFRTLWPLFQFSAPLPGLFGSSLQDQISAEPTPLDTVKGISLADAKKLKKERRKHMLLNSRVVGGSPDVRLPSGPDVSKPFFNAVETLKTNQQFSFTPSAASQFIFPYQMCFFAGPFPGSRAPIHVAQPRTFPLGSPALIPSIFDRISPTKSPYQLPLQQNFFSLSINNYPNAPFPRQPTQISEGSAFGSPIHQQFSQFPGPNRQPIFCTFLQPPLFQFPTQSGTADFGHAKCVDCQEDSPQDALFAEEFIFPSAKETLCGDEKIPCKDGSGCVAASNWCDNLVQCKDASDEAFCSCRERVARNRVCDGYVDCPHGEDEIGCFDCPKSAFSCDSAISPGSCIPLNKRCDGVRDCATGADETDCSALFFHVRQNNSYQVSQVTGYLHRNWKGDWFPVCVEIGESVWAKEACLAELGAMSSGMDVKFISVPLHYKGPFIVRKEDGTADLQNHCKGHVSTFVKCPAMSCGTRIELYTLQEFENRYFQEREARQNGRSISVRKTNLTNTEFSVKQNVEGLRPKREETGRVVGGRESEPRAWPWAIAVYKNGAFHCGGVILDEKWVLTAAHCMEQYWKHYYEVRGGMLRRFSFSAMEQTRRVSHVIIHENYDNMIMSSDLALLRLREPFHFNRWVRPACLPALMDGVSKFISGPAPGTRCIAVGWGALRERGTDPDQLREVEIPILTRCKHKEDLVGEEICAGKAEGGKDTCQGDSGGPLLCRDSSSPASWYVAGIVSHGEGCARPGEPGAYTRISLFVDWITANSNDFKLPSLEPLQHCPGFRCRSASKLCIPHKWICNGYADCLEAEDEKNCTLVSDPLNAFSRQYSKDWIWPDNVLHSKTNSSATASKAETRKENIKEAKHSEKGTETKETDGFFLNEEDWKTTEGLESKISALSMTSPPLTTLTESFTIRTTPQHIVGSESIEMETLVTAENLFKLTATTESSRNSEKLKIFDKKHKKVVGDEKEESKIELKEKDDTEEKEEEEKGSETNKHDHQTFIKFGEKEHGEKHEDLIEEEEEKSENKNKNVTDEYKEKNRGKFKKITGTALEEKEEERDNAEEHKENKTIEDETDEEVEENGFETEDEYDDEVEDEYRLLDKETNKVEETSHKTTDKEETEETSTSSEDTSSESTSEKIFLTTDFFLIRDFSEGTTTETQVETEAEKEAEVFTEYTELSEPEQTETSTRGETDSGLITERLSTTADADGTISIQSFEGITKNPEIEFSEGRTSSQHSVRARQTVQTYVDEELFSTLSFDSTTVNVITDASMRSAEFVSTVDSDFFQCRLIVQSILAKYVCDGLKDCEDGTDEENCTCTQALLSSNPKLVCDGRVDCPDQSDEKNCSKCPEEAFHCKISDECIPLRKRCNGISDCKSGEDEAKCRALAHSSEPGFKPDREAFLQTEGVLFVNRKGIWTIKCQEEERVFAAGEAIEICSDLKTIGYERYENRSVASDCTAFHVTCAKSLVSSIERYQHKNGSYLWPWNAFVYSDGRPLCSAVLLQPQWLLTSSHCLKDVSLRKNYLVAKLGARSWSSEIKEAEARVRIDGIHVIPKSETALLRLSKVINETESVRTLGIPYTFDSDPAKDLCVAVGDRTVFLRISELCPESSRCYKKVGSTPFGCKSKPWVGVVACQSRFGWYPSSVFTEVSGHCGFEHVKFISLRESLKSFHGAWEPKVEVFSEPVCLGFRCSLGLCIPRSKMCNGWPDCPSEEDESFHLCSSNKQTKECKMTELKCKSGHCIPKVLFGDGRNDCEDGSDEPLKVTCVEYLRLTAPERICDGRRNCYDKTDEDFRLCSCDERKFQCNSPGYCVPKDFVCDGERDCPDGEDEDHCMGRKIFRNSTKSHLEVMQRSYGIWHTVCPTSLSKERSDALCRDLGFKMASLIYEKNQTVIAPEVDAFSWVKLNRRTSLALRGDKPFVRLVTLRKTCGFVKCA